MAPPRLSIYFRGGFYLIEPSGKYGDIPYCYVVAHEEECE
jgi:hypothetical protein